MISRRVSMEWKSIVEPETSSMRRSFTLRWIRGPIARVTRLRASVSPSSVAAKKATECLPLSAPPTFEVKSTSTASVVFPLCSPAATMLKRADREVQRAWAA